MPKICRQVYPWILREAAGKHKKQCFSLSLNRMRKFICKGLPKSGINWIIFVIDYVVLSIDVGFKAMVFENLFLIKYESKPCCTVFQGRGYRVVELDKCCGDETTIGVWVWVGVWAPAPAATRWGNKSCLNSMVPEEYLLRASCAGCGAKHWT